MEWDGMGWNGIYLVRDVGCTDDRRQTQGKYSRISPAKNAFFRFYATIYQMSVRRRREFPLLSSSVDHTTEYPVSCH